MRPVKTGRIARSSADFRNSARRLIREDALRVVFEPAGPYHRFMEKTLAEAKIDMVNVNPRYGQDPLIMALFGDSGGAGRPF
ncbi:hypothetical protein [Gemmobacter sp. 24YEA27]|uniref:hypothetical protein n=1 Tax=Gemmobacter sp. 24YEA27 TaxID=3040672 RepID=UPI0024B39918|nr:hypothetical protein [Gemmobacter sp. 24YEA27]